MQYWPLSAYSHPLRPARLLRAENEKNRFLDQCKVIFIVDPPKKLPSRK